MNSVRQYSMNMETLICSGCQLEIKDARAMKAGNRYWHQQHFVCQECGLRLRDDKVFQKDGKLYCEIDYKSKFVPRCASCSGFILENCIRALNQSWHPEHFTCKKCGIGFQKDQSFHERNGYPYCKNCYVDEACEKCAGCFKPITDKSLRAMDKDWHVQCFVCKTCRKSFEGEKSFFCISGQPVCANCIDD